MTTPWFQRPEILRTLKKKTVAEVPGQTQMPNGVYTGEGPNGISEPNRPTGLYQRQDGSQYTYDESEYVIDAPSVKQLGGAMGVQRLIEQALGGQQAQRMNSGGPVTPGIVDRYNMGGPVTRYRGGGYVDRYQQGGSTDPYTTVDPARAPAGNFIPDKTIPTTGAPTSPTIPGTPGIADPIQPPQPPQKPGGVMVEPPPPIAPPITQQTPTVFEPPKIQTPEPFSPTNQPFAVGETPQVVIPPQAAPPPQAPADVVLPPGETKVTPPMAEPIEAPEPAPAPDPIQISIDALDKAPPQVTPGGEPTEAELMRQKALEFLQGIMEGNNPYLKTVVNRALQDFGAINTARRQAMRQQLAQRGLSEAEIGQQMRLFDRDVSSQQSRLIGDMAEMSQGQMTQAARELANEAYRDIGRDDQQQFREYSSIQQDYLDALDRAAESGSQEGYEYATKLYEDMRARFPQYTSGVGPPPKSTLTSPRFVQNLRDYNALMTDAVNEGIDTYESLLTDVDSIDELSEKDLEDIRGSSSFETYAAGRKKAATLTGEEYNEERAWNDYKNLIDEGIQRRTVVDNAFEVWEDNAQGTNRELFFDTEEERKAIKDYLYDMAVTGKTLVDPDTGLLSVDVEDSLLPWVKGTDTEPLFFNWDGTVRADELSPDDPVYQDYQKYIKSTDKDERAPMTVWYENRQSGTVPDGYITDDDGNLVQEPTGEDAWETFKTEFSLEDLTGTDLPLAQRDTFDRYVAENGKKPATIGDLREWYNQGGFITQNLVSETGGKVWASDNTLTSGIDTKARLEAIINSDDPVAKEFYANPGNFLQSTGEAPRSPSSDEQFVYWNHDSGRFIATDPGRKWLEDNAGKLVEFGGKSYIVPYDPIREGEGGGGNARRGKDDRIMLYDVEDGRYVDVYGKDSTVKVGE